MDLINTAILLNINILQSMFKLFVKCYTCNYFNFYNRASRKEYLSFILFYIFIRIFYKFIIITFGYSLDFHFLIKLLHLFLIIPFISLNSRRLHDFGYSGFFQFILILSYISVKIFSYTPPIIIELIFIIILLKFLKKIQYH